MIKLTAEQARALKDDGGDWEGERQGDIFKSRTAFESGEGVCYLNEYSDSWDTECGEEIHEGYTREDFLNLVGGNPKRAEILFFWVDWECPETALDSNSEADLWGED